MSNQTPTHEQLERLLAVVDHGFPFERSTNWLWRYAERATSDVRERPHTRLGRLAATTATQIDRYGQFLINHNLNSPFHRLRSKLSR